LGRLDPGKADPGVSGAGLGDEVALFHRTLAELCRASVPLPRALRILEAEAESKALGRAARAMADDVEAGRTLSEAYAAHGRVFPALYRRLVASGERSGDLPGALEQIAGHAAHRADVAARMRRALAYPVTTAIFVLLVGVGALTFASPRLWAFTERVSGSSPWPVALGALGGLGLFVAAVLFFAWRRRGTSLFGGYRIPVLGPLRLTAARASLASTLALLLRCRVPLHEALRLAAETAENQELGRRVLVMAEEAEGGEGLVPAIRAGSLFEPSLLWLVETGERSGAAADALADVAAIYRQRLSRGLDRCSVLLRPAMELVVGVAVFLIAYSFMVPLFEYANGMLRLGV
jgi:general secretion pathway protein F